jgi:hypothetical protein
MAKVTGPLMSMDASGKFAGALVFSKWKGRPTVRQLVTPANPQNASQTTQRNMVRVMGAAQHFANLTAQVQSTETQTDKVVLTSLAPAGQAWNGFLVKSGIGAGSVNYDAATAAYAALAAGEKTAWVNAAAALVPAILDVAQSNPFGAAGTPMSQGEVFFHYVYALYMAGENATAPGATPPTYA